jgi:hypothetical protein
VQQSHRNTTAKHTNRVTNGNNAVINAASTVCRHAVGFVKRKAQTRQSRGIGLSVQEFVSILRSNNLLLAPQSQGILHFPGDATLLAGFFLP